MNIVRQMRRLAAVRARPASCTRTLRRDWSALAPHCGLARCPGLRRPSSAAATNALPHVHLSGGLRPAKALQRRGPGPCHATQAQRRQMSSLAGIMDSVRFDGSGRALLPLIVGIDPDVWGAVAVLVPRELASLELGGAPLGAMGGDAAYSDGEASGRLPWESSDSEADEGPRELEALLASYTAPGGTDEADAGLHVDRVALPTPDARTFDDMSPAQIAAEVARMREGGGAPEADGGGVDASDMAQRHAELCDASAAQLKEQCKAAGLPVSGRKAQLASRLVAASCGLIVPAAVEGGGAMESQETLLGVSVGVTCLDTPRAVALVNGKRRARLDQPRVLEMCRQVMMLQHTETDAAGGAGASRDVVVFLERPQIIPGRQGGIMLHTSGFYYGFWTGVMEALGAKVVPVTPNSWKAQVGLSGSGRGKSASVEVARQAFPGLEGHLSAAKHHGRGDALLIALCGLRRAMMAAEAALEDAKASDG
ncbi:unnamed protein product [Pedinophyceae sp. YPF-701]|nr:unnamed protein product [Pedinophyceae sp. YPF-701]